MEITKVVLPPETMAEKSRHAQNELDAALSKAVFASPKLKGKTLEELVKLTDSANPVRVQRALAGEQPLYSTEVLALMKALDLQLMVK